MPTISGALINCSQQPPIKIDVAYVKGYDEKYTIEQFLQRPVRAIPLKNGVIYTAEHDPNDPNPGQRNPIASKLASENGESHDLYGPCYFIAAGDEETVVGKDGKEKVKIVNLKKNFTEAFKNIKTFFKDITGVDISGRKKRRAGPKRPKRDFDFFQKNFQRERRAELEKKGQDAKFDQIAAEARTKWATLSDSEKQPYVDQAQQDKERYEREMEDFKEKHPSKPKRPRNAYHMYCITNNITSKDSNNQWKSMSDEEKEKYKQMAEEDREKRYKPELEKYRIWCEKSGVDFEAQTSRKKRKSPVKDDNEEGNEEKEVKPKKKIKTRAKKAKAEEKESKDENDDEESDEPVKKKRRTTSKAKKPAAKKAAKKGEKKEKGEPKAKKPRKSRKKKKDEEEAMDVDEE